MTRRALALFGGIGLMATCGGNAGNRALPSGGAGGARAGASGATTVPSSGGAGGSTAISSGGAGGAGGSTVSVSGGADGSPGDSAWVRLCRPAPPCPIGWFEYKDTLCGPNGSSLQPVCSSNGDGLCYQSCSGSASCEDPRFPHCGSIRMFYGSDVFQEKSVCMSSAPAPSCDSPARPAHLSQSTALLDLGVVPLATTATATLDFKNDGDGFGKLSITPSSGLTTSGCSDDVAPQGSCTLTVQFKPTTPGAFVGQLDTSSSANDTLGAFVLARVTSQRFKVSPEKLAVGALAMGTAAPAQTITVTAVDDLTGLTVAPVGDGATIDQAATTCSSSLPSGSACVVVVKYAPTVAGVSSAEVELRADGGGDPLRVPILARTSASTRLTIDPQPIEEFAGTTMTSRRVEIDVINPGASAQTSLSVEVSGPNASDFSIDKKVCLNGSPVGICTLPVKFAPFSSTAASPRTATLKVTASSGGTTSETVSVPLTGTVYPDRPLDIDSQIEADLDSVTVGTMGPTTQVLVHNRGETLLGPLTVSLSNSEFRVVVDKCTGASIEGGGEYCTLDLALEPATAGRKIGLLLVKGPEGVAAGKTLSGVGVVAGEPIINPLHVDFGKVPPGQMSQGKTIIIQNLSGQSTSALAVGGFLSPSHPFYKTQDTCVAALAPGASCSFTVYLVALGNRGPASRDVFVIVDKATWRSMDVTGFEGNF